MNPGERALSVIGSAESIYRSLGSRVRLTLPRPSRSGDPACLSVPPGLFHETMKHLRHTFLVVISATVVAFSAGPAFADDAGTRQYLVGVEGMSCPMNCAPKVQESLKNLDGVDNVDVKFEDKQAVVTMKPGETLTQDACDKAFGNSGYFVSSFAEGDDGAEHGDGG